MKILVLSDVLKIDEPKEITKGGELLTICTWRNPNFPPLFDYEVVVLDMRINVNEIPTECYSSEKGTYQNKAKENEKVLISTVRLGEINKQLLGGGVCILIAAQSRNIDIIQDFTYARTTAPGSLIENINKKQIPTYKWFEGNTYFNKLKLEITLTAGTNIELLSNKKVFKDYFNEKEKIEYYKIIRPYREDSFNKIAVNKVTGDSVAGFSEIGKGTLIIIPEKEGQDKLILENLIGIGKEFYKTRYSKEHISQPIWVNEYKSKHEKDVDKNLEEHRKKRTKLDSIKTLLYAGGDSLVDGIINVFEDFGYTAENTKKAFPTDIFIKEGKKLIFAIEATGTVNKISRTDKKITQVLDYIQTHSRDEKVILMANTHKDKEIKERPKENFTPTAVNFLEKNEVCMITTVELYNLWIKFIEGKISKEKITESLLNSNGLFKLTKQ